MISASSQSLVTLFEVEGLSPEQIAQCEDVDLMSVKTILMQYSKKYRELMRKGGEEVKAQLDYTEDEQRDAKDVLHRIMLQTEDEHLQYKCATYIRDDGKGRKDKVKIKGLNLNLTLIQQAFQKANDCIEQSRQTSHIIDIPANEQKLILKPA